MPIDISALRERRSDSTLTVTELNEYIKSLFDNSRMLASVTVKGEISNLVYHRTGHLYFSLKDSGGQIRAVMFRSHAAGLKFLLENGMKVIIHGSVSVFTRDGSYQLYANSVQPDGIGALYLAYEQLKEKLALEGLFDKEFKRPLPKYPIRIGVITSPTGAAVRDIINVISRRYPLADMYLYPSLVQGDGAEDNLIRGIDFFDRSKLCDVVIIGRGGGSIEDLWAFNSERLARRIFSSTVPVISAVGHETDFTICDFVSDMRAPTPSAAAELATPDIRECFLKVDGYASRLCELLLLSVERMRQRLKNVTSSYVFADPYSLIREKREELTEISEKLNMLITDKTREKRIELGLIAEKLGALNPLSVLSRGYSYATVSDRGITSVEDISVGDCVRVEVKDGNFTATVTAKETKKR